MEYVEQQTENVGFGKIMCCECGTLIDPNSANMCVACIRTKVDITEGIPKQNQLYWCKFCERYLQPPNAWLPGALESKELLAICLKKMKGLSKVRLVDAGFVWTEPHSRRIKVKLTVQKEVMNGAVLQQVFVVEFTVHSQMCDDCRRIENKDFWRACVQVRQKATQKKTLFYLEQLVLKHKAHVNTTGIKPMHGGIDFYYAKIQDARKMVDFLQEMLPCRYQHAQELVTHDTHNNTYDYKNTFSVELVPICKDDLVCLPKKLAHSLGNIGRICLCTRISNSIHLIDPLTGQIADVSGTEYWRYPFEVLCYPKMAIEFTIIDIEMSQINLGSGHGAVSSKHAVSDAWVVKSDELGSAEQTSVRTHLGFLLKPGDTALGYDLANANVNNREFDTLKDPPDIILLKKVFDRSRRIRRRKWRLKRLAENAMETESMENDYNEFLDDLEDDPLYRLNVNIYKDRERLAVPVESETDDENAPQISLQEMLDDLHLDDAEMEDQTAED